MRRLVLITLIVTMILFLLPEPVLTQAFAQNYDSKISEYEIIADDSSDEFTAGVLIWMQVLFQYIRLKT